MQYLCEQKRIPASLKLCPVLLNINFLQLTVPERPFLIKMNNKKILAQEQRNDKSN